MASWALGTTEGTVSAELMGQESDSRVGEGRGETCAEDSFKDVGSGCGILAPAVAGLRGESEGWEGGPPGQQGRRRQSVGGTDCPQRNRVTH